MTTNEQKTDHASLGSQSQVPAQSDVAHPITAHTPGPGPWFGVYLRNEVDAHLIAAAPDLLTALKRLQTAIVERDLWHGQEDELDAATHAIAKAEGRS